MNLALAIGSALLFAILLSIEPTIGNYWSKSEAAGSPDTWQHNVSPADRRDGGLLRLD